jgi:endonuclease/exonuclease/phosphatase family metal-dependent hydrolase
VTDQVPRLSLLPAEGGRVERCRPVLNGTPGMVLGEAVVALSEQNPPRVTRVTVPRHWRHGSVIPPGATRAAALGARTMKTVKLTTWNIAWFDHSWGVLEGRYEPRKKRAQRRLPTLDKARCQANAVRDEIGRIAPDILFLCEAPAGEAAITSWVSAELPAYDIVRRSSGTYATKGDQWQWFLIRKELADRLQPELLDITVWRDFAARASPSIRLNGTWSVSMPRLRTVGGVTDVPVAERSPHSFYRHPQTLLLTIAGERVEVIGAHLKSKFTSGTPRMRRAEESFDDYAKDPKVAAWLADAHAARIKLSSEAQNIRAYIDHRFRQTADPSILVLGDLNDGPGKELMEREYLLHDLISNLQGDVFFAQQFLNHALFDRPQHLRWTVRFHDVIDPERDPKILLDHILFTQALTTGGTGPLRVYPGAGLVEHLAHEETEAAFGKDVASDHRPVSVVLSLR